MMSYSLTFCQRLALVTFRDIRPHSDPNHYVAVAVSLQCVCPFEFTAETVSRTN